MLFRSYLILPSLSHPLPGPFPQSHIVPNPMPIMRSWSQLSRTPILPPHLPNLVLATAGLLRDRKLCLLIPPSRTLLSQLLIAHPNLYQGVPPPVQLRPLLPILPLRLLPTIAPLSIIPPESAAKSPTPYSFLKSQYRCPRRRSSTPLLLPGLVPRHIDG